MQGKNLHNLEEKDLLKIIKTQQEEIEALKARIDSLENRIKQIETNSFENNVHDDTKDKSLKNTSKGKDEIIDTKEKEESQTKNKENLQLMVLPKHSSLAVLLPQFLKKLLDKRKLRLAIVYSLTLLVLAFSGFQIARINIQKNHTNKLTQELKNYININTDLNESNNFKVDFDGLKAKNSDTCGWIIINGIDISFPVVKSTNNEYYLKHSFDKTYNPCGWIFADYKNNLDGTDRNIIIYGHNRRDNTMFSPLTNILTSNWYDNEQNKYVKFITPEGETTYEVFSIYQTEVEDYYIQTNFKSTKDYLDFLNTLKGRSTKDYHVDLNANDQILTISTCGKESKHRIVLHAKKIMN